MRSILMALTLGVVTMAAVARELEVRHAAEIEYEAERGHYYQLQRSTNLTDWVNVEDKVYGHGGRERRLRTATPDDGATKEFFRVLVTEAPVEGLAPWTYAGVTLNLDDQPGGDAVQFLTETNGVDLGVAPDPFVYTFTRTGTNQVRVEARPPGLNVDRNDVYVFTYTAAGRGTWVRDEYRKGVIKDRDLGVFTHLVAGGGGAAGGTTSTNQPTVTLPTTVASTPKGLSYSFQSGESRERLEFSTEIGGTEYSDDVGDTEPNVFTYTFSLASTNSAKVVVTYKVGKWDEYDLSYSSASKGNFVRREYKDGVLDDTDTGVFSAIVMPVSGGTGATSGGTNGGGNTGGTGGGTTNPNPTVGPMPSGSLAGLTYTMRSSTDSVSKLIVSSATAGVEQGDSDTSPFTYTYTLTTPRTAVLKVTFKSDKWDEYQLTSSDGNNAGTFVLQRFDKSTLKDTRTGLFGGQATAP